MSIPSSRLPQGPPWKIVLAIAVFALCFSAAFFTPGLLTSPSPSASQPVPPPSDPPPVTATPPNGTQSPATTSPPQTTTQPAVNPSLTVAGTQSLTVHSPTGAIGALRGNLNGTLTWNTQAADAVTIVVQSWVPGDGWAQTRRVHTTQTSPVVLADVLESPVVYANHSRASAFENPTDGTTQTRQGAIAITAVFFADGDTQQRLTDTMTYTVAVTNVDQSDDDGSSGNVAIELGIGTTGDSADGGGDPTLVNGTQLVPGAQYASTARLSNSGSDAGTVYFNVSYQSFENGIANEAEASVDSTGGDPGRGNGELHQAVELRIVRVEADGSRTYILGNASSYRDLTTITQPVPLTDLSPDETADLRVEYRIESTTGNEIQSDTIALDFHFLIQS